VKRKCQEAKNNPPFLLGGGGGGSAVFEAEKRVFEIMLAYIMPSSAEEDVKIMADMKVFQN
jgi:hypothetical protein